MLGNILGGSLHIGVSFFRIFYREDLLIQDIYRLGEVYGMDVSGRSQIYK